MKNSKVVKVEAEALEFDNGIVLKSHHESDCCESHYLDFSDLTLADFEGLEFDLTSETFFRRIEDYGIELVPVKGFSVKVPGYGYNNGYYSHDLTLVISNKEGFTNTFDITECQRVSDE